MPHCGYALIKLKCETMRISDRLKQILEVKGMILMKDEILMWKDW